MRFASLAIVCALLILGPGVESRPAAGMGTTHTVEDWDLVTPEEGWAFLGGRLFWTHDGGNSWQDVTPAEGGWAIAAVSFPDAEAGFAVLVAADGEGWPLYALARTGDGGREWRIGRTELFRRGDAAGLPGAVRLHFADRSSGTLTVVQATSANFDLSTHWATADGGATWQASEEGAPGEAEEAAGMATPRAGWRLVREGRCEPSPAGSRKPVRPETCRQVTSLLRTDDGGRSWAPLALPEVAARAEPAVPARSGGAAGAPWGNRSRLAQGAGFDKCECPALEELETWWAESPYDAVNLYVGGISRACANQGLTAEYVAAAREMGWQFIPTWVGLQAPCSGYAHRMSSDPAIAYLEGQAEGAEAIARLGELGLLDPEGRGSVVYADIEAYNTTLPACRAAVNAYVDGWSAALQANGTLAGAYGAGCASAPTDWASLEHAPDAIWLAHWIRPAYDPEVTVWGVACTDDGLWDDHERLRQYTGGHNETWGGVTLNIDCDVLDGVVADPWAGRLVCPPEGCRTGYLPVVVREAVDP